MVLPSSLSNATRRCGCAFSRDSSCCGDDALRFLTQTSSVVVQCQPWFYLRLAAYSFFWLSEGAYGYSRDSVPKHWFGLTRLWILTLEPERLKNRRPPPAMNPGMDGALNRRSSCLLFQMLGVETHSFLPDQQSDRRNLPGQGEAGHRRLHPSGNGGGVVFLERSRYGSGSGRRTLENIF
jgi:hypothetical protein